MPRPGVLHNPVEQGGEASPKMACGAIDPLPKGLRGGSDGVTLPESNVLEAAATLIEGAHDLDSWVPSAEAVGCVKECRSFFESRCIRGK